MMPQKRKKHNFIGNFPQNESSRNIKMKQNERQWVKRSENSIFSIEELQEIKNILKRKHLAKTPAIINATVLNKCNVIDELLKKGDDVNEPDETGATALVWGVRTKKIEATILLLKTDNVCLKPGVHDHILFTALSLPIWNESEFYNLWTNVKALYPVGVNILSKDGRSLLHYAVERDWLGFINILISENADINIHDINGLTPVMLACVKENLKIIEYFIDRSVDLLFEDCIGFTTLCYVISTVSRNRDARFLTEKLFEDDAFLRDYCKSRLDVLDNGPPALYSNQSSVMLLDIFKYLMNQIPKSIGLFNEFDIWSHIKPILTNSDNVMKLRFILSVAWEYFKLESESMRNVQICLDALVALLFKHKHIHQEILGKLALRAIINLTMRSQIGKKALENHNNIIFRLMKNYNDDDVTKFLHTKDDIWTCAPEKVKEFLNCLTILHEGGIFTQRVSNTSLNGESDIHVEERNIKRSKRRSKGLKSKIQKGKYADAISTSVNSDSIILPNVSESKSNEDSANLDYDVNEQFAEETMLVEDVEIDRTLQPEDETSSSCKIPFKICVKGLDDANIYICDKNECILVNAIKNSNLKDSFIERENIKQNHSKPSTHCHKSDDDWKTTILNLPFVNKHVPKLELDQDYKSSNINSPYSDVSMKQTDFQVKITHIIKYLNTLLKKIIDKYNAQWQIDDELEQRVQSDPVKSTGEAVAGEMKRETMEMLKSAFYDMTEQIKQISTKDQGETMSLINNLEGLLLEHDIRGKTIKDEVAGKEIVEICCKYLNDYGLVPNYTIEKYMEDVLNKKRETSKNVLINVIESTKKLKIPTHEADMLYLQEIMQLPPRKPINTQKMHEAKLETMKFSYHLVGSIMKICDSDDELLNIDPTTKMSSIAQLSSSNSKIKCSRWCSLVRSLEMSTDCQTLLEGTVRISCQRKRSAHVISTGGNFTPVELGLDSGGMPLAVKRIPKGSNVCTMIKNTITDLLDIKHVNILHYCVCDYENNELVLATALCEYNIGQYLMLMKQKKITSLTTLEIVTQLLNGIMYLHEHSPAIIHGNLKPSNIFIDLNGNVRIAEFGIHEALFKLKEAPNSSVIWFASETYTTFKQTAIMQCTLETDIQVAGMLLHFIFTGGTHAYGIDTKDILKNLEEATPKLICTDLELKDLLMWMLKAEPSGRPTIRQSPQQRHVYFWTMERRWQFILTCCGITSARPNLPEYDQKVQMQDFMSNIVDDEHIKCALTNFLFPLL